MKLNHQYHHIAIYLRISQEKKNETEETLKNHREILIGYAQSIKCTYDIYGEVISGGKSELEDRKELKRLLSNIEEYDAILCFELSRLSRNGLISQTVKQHSIDYGKSILTPYHEYDLANNENDRLMFDLGSLIASHEHSVIGKRSKLNKIQMSKAGLHVSGNVPFGYVRNNTTKRLEIKEEDAKVVRYIFELHSIGLGSFKIRDILNSEGYKTSKNNPFGLPTIKRIIKNPVYKGTIVFNDRKRKKKNGKFIYEIVDTIVVDKAHPWIISPEEWERVNQDRIARANNASIIREKPACKTGTTMLKDLIYCGICGRKMSIRKDNKSSTSYTIKRCEYLLTDGVKCKNSGIKLEFVENEIHKEIQEFKVKLIKSVDLLESNDFSNIEQQLVNRLNQIDKKLEEVLNQEKRLIDLAVERIFSIEDIRVKKQNLLSLKQSLGVDKNKILKELNNHSNESKGEKMNGIIETIENLKGKNAEQVNLTLKTFINKIYYSRVIPEELLVKSTRNDERRCYPFTLEIDYKE
ncbi:recombinase family protein [Rossellomorea aquimaris]|uniref:DNA invertase Pin-like site-specific DNA recombinase n=1 Tax=Rossellomorea aquimaris TaxID=189382 RepID=A0A366EI92_9BACI|nr:recombinase family protein [Rossellomorea aquimaris]RBP02132.1 DNA invertase Pin-like site-specific DNA recombinase [Rossellomorea aquimaris]